MCAALANPLKFSEKLENSKNKEGKILKVEITVFPQSVCKKIKECSTHLNLSNSENPGQFWTIIENSHL